jgi:hypothetical protein
VPSASHQLCRAPKPAFRTLSVELALETTAAQTAQSCQWTAFPNFSTPKTRRFVPAEIHAANTSAIDGLVQLGAYLLAPRAD